MRSYTRVGREGAARQSATGQPVAGLGAFRIRNRCLSSKIIFINSELALSINILQLSKWVRYSSECCRAELERRSPNDARQIELSCETVRYSNLASHLPDDLLLIIARLNSSRLLNGLCARHR